MMQFDLQDTADCGRNWVVDFNAVKTQLVYLTSLIIPVLLIRNQATLLLRKKSSFKMLVFSFSFKLDWGSYVITIVKLFSWKLEPWFVLWSLFLLRLICISINLTYGLSWNPVFMSRLVLLASTCNCWINYKNRFVGLLVPHLLPLLNLWLIVKMHPA